MIQNTSQKVLPLSGDAENSLNFWKNRFMESEIRGMRSHDIEKKIELQLQRFIDFFQKRYHHDLVSAVVKRDVKAWIDDLYNDGEGFAASYVNNHKAHLSLFMGWLHHKAPYLLPEDPTKGRGLKDILLPAPEPEALTYEQYISLKNICDRLERFHQLKGRRWKGRDVPLKKNARPKRDRAIVFTLMSTGIRREMLVNLNLQQLQPNEPDALRKARRAKIIRIRGKGRTEQTKFLSFDARMAIADYLQFERPRDADSDSVALFLVAEGIGERKPGGRLHVRSINRVLEQIGKWHDAEQPDIERHISPLRPHALRHTFAFLLAKETGGDRFELQRRLGHRSDKYIEIYTHPPEDEAAGYIEKL